MKKPSKAALQRVKSTLVGRLLCRLVGEQTGAVMMEYVVLGVLVVAAVVGLVVAFGDQIGKSFKHMIYALQGKHKTLVTDVPADNTTIQTEVKTADGERKTIAGGE